MKKSLFTTALPALLGAALVSLPFTLHAQTTPTATTTAPAAKSTAKSKYTSYAGKLTAIDTANNDVTVTGTKRTLILNLATTTTYQVDKKSATLSSFAVGDKVTGSYLKNADGSLTAHSLHKSTVRKSAAKAAATPATAAPTPAPATPAAAPAAQ
ncbi:MAG: hypothetical protein LV479_08870 [Methylacidiphilales bacterium]|nr:hypothetical protein [Candidatus Methylacidiphilales bacterium]